MPTTITSPESKIIPRISLIVAMCASCAMSYSVTVYTNKNFSRGIFQQHQYLWITTNGGLRRWDMSLNKGDEFTTANGLPGNDLGDGIIDRKGDAWFLADSGPGTYDGRVWLGRTGFNGDGYWLSALSVDDSAVYACRMRNNSTFGMLRCADVVTTELDSAPFIRSWRTKSGVRQTFSALASGYVLTVSTGVASFADTVPLWDYFMITESHVDQNGRLWVPAINSAASDPTPTYYSVFDSTRWRHITSTYGINIKYPPEAIDTGAGKYAFRLLTIDSMVDTVDFQNWSEVTAALPNVCLPPTMCIDTAGRIWFASAAGVVRCDASGCTEFPIGTDPAVNFSYTSPCEDRAGRIWTVGNGVSSFDGTTWRNHPVTMPGGTPFRVSGIVSADSGRMWLRSGTWNDEQAKMRGQGIALVRNDDWNDIRFVSSANGLTGDCVVDMALDSSGALWCLSVDDTRKAMDLSRFKEGSWGVIPRPSGLKGWVRGLFADSRGGIWLLCANEARFDGSAWTVFDTIIYEGLAGVNPIFEDSKGQMWFGTGTKGLYRYNTNGWTLFNEFSNSSAGRMVTAISEDAAGKVWAGLGCSWTGSGFINCAGLVQIDGDTWQKVPGSDTIPFMPLGVIMRERSGAMWCAANPGVVVNGDYRISRYDGSKWRSFTLKDGFSDMRVSSLLEASNGDLWFGTNNGFTRLQGTIAGVADRPVITRKAGSRVFPLLRIRIGGTTARLPGNMVSRCIDIRGRIIKDHPGAVKRATGVEILIIKDERMLR